MAQRGLFFMQMETLKGQQTALELVQGPELPLFLGGHIVWPVMGRVGKGVSVLGVSPPVLWQGPPKS